MSNDDACHDVIPWTRYVDGYRARACLWGCTITCVADGIVS